MRGHLNIPMNILLVDGLADLRLTQRGFLVRKDCPA